MAMRLCDSHWLQVKERLPEKKWLLASLQTTQMVVDESNTDTYRGDIFALQREIESQGGCPMCFMGKDAFERLIKKCLDFKEMPRVPGPGDSFVP